MAMSDVIRPGDKIEIRMLQQVENSGKTGTEATVYKSQVLDVLENGNLEIAMPIEAGRMVLLPLGIRYEFVFYSAGSLYRGLGLIVERYKRDNLYMLVVELKSHLEKFQRREYYRYNCTLNFGYFVLNEEQIKMTSADEILSDLMDVDFKEKRRAGVIVDISGGGMKFRSEDELKAGDQILVMLRLTSDKSDRQFQIRSNVIDCVKVKTTKDILYESRIKFIIEDNRIREEIIRYIFEEERRIRQKENG